MAYPSIGERVIDLSHEIDESMPLWPGDPPVILEAAAEIGADGYGLRRVQFGEHCGTHMNAPASFYSNGIGIEAYEAANLVRPAIVMDVRQQVSRDRDYALSEADIHAWETIHGTIPEGALVLLSSGWDMKWAAPADYLGLDERSQPHYPGFGLAAARFLVEERGVAGVGTDTPGAEPGIDAGFAVNRLVLARPRVVLENLRNLHLVPAVGAVLVIGILKFKGGSGSPAAVLAFVS